MPKTLLFFAIFCLFGFFSVFGHFSGETYLGNFQILMFTRTDLHVILIRDNLEQLLRWLGYTSLDSSHEILALVIGTESEWKANT